MIYIFSFIFYLSSFNVSSSTFLFSHFLSTSSSQASIPPSLSLSLSLSLYYVLLDEGWIQRTKGYTEEAVVYSQARRVECPIRHSTRQKIELELEPGHKFTIAEPKSIFNTCHKFEPGSSS
jgi:hypothetical protein